MSVPAEQQPGVMDSLLSDSEPLPDVEELNCLIYRSSKDIDEALEETKENEKNHRSWTASNEHVTVRIWESKASIRVKVSTSAAKSISMERIAEIAAQAIMAELNKEEQ